jgi:hypothetical protein
MLYETQGQKGSHMKSDNRHIAQTKIINKCFLFYLETVWSTSCLTRKKFFFIFEEGMKNCKKPSCCESKSQGKESVKSTLALGCWPDAQARTSKFLPYS